MFGIGFTEVLLIMLVVLVLFGPEQIPVITRDIARIVIKLKKYSEQIKKELGFDELARLKDVNYLDYPDTKDVKDETMKS